MTFRIVRATHNKYFIQRLLINGTWAMTRGPLENVVEAWKQLDAITAEAQAVKKAGQEVGWHEVARKEV